MDLAGAEHFSSGCSCSPEFPSMVPACSSSVASTMLGSVSILSLEVLVHSNLKFRNGEEWHSKQQTVFWKLLKGDTGSSEGIPRLVKVGPFFLSLPGSRVCANSKATALLEQSILLRLKLKQQQKQCESPLLNHSPGLVSFLRIHFSILQRLYCFLYGPAICMPENSLATPLPRNEPALPGPRLLCLSNLERTRLWIARKFNLLDGLCGPMGLVVGSG